MSAPAPSHGTSPEAAGHHGGRGHDHVVPVGVYLAVFAALMVLTIATVAASRVDLGRLNTPVALGIAVTKAALVVLFFMHVKYSSRVVALFLAAAFFWLFQLIAGTLVDYASRTPLDPRPNHPVGIREPGS
jgi:cytochrome c oxidase subunit IV